MSPQQIIARNFPGPEHDDASFLGRLHEEWLWDSDEYWKLEWALYQLATKTRRSRDITWRIFRIFSHAFLSVNCHFDPRDAFRIGNLADDEICELRERLQLVFEGYFSGSMPKLSNFKTRNPLLEPLSE